MSDQEIEVLVVGAGQAGIAMSEHLSSQGVIHLVVERDRIAERWHSWRWDSLVANGPAWHDRFPGQEFDVDPDAFATSESHRHDRHRSAMRSRSTTRWGTPSKPRCSLIAMPA